MNDHYVIFVVADTHYALPSQHIAHVEMVEQITRVPNAPSFVDGVMFSRGTVVAAINLRARFGFPRAPLDTRTRLLVVQIDGRTVGLLVDSAREFLAIPESAIKPPSEVLATMSGRYVRGIFTSGERMILILDLHQVLNPEDPAVASATSAAAHFAQEVR